eukprot:m.120864 g.120864  ORF g.120864 m.120864 type:complete len:125 (+) comp14373_c1_seq2:104-478(+)
MPDEPIMDEKTSLTNNGLEQSVLEPAKSVKSRRRKYAATSFITVAVIAIIGSVVYIGIEEANVHETPTEPAEFQKQLSVSTVMGHLIQLAQIANKSSPSSRSILNQVSIVFKLTEETIETDRVV